jgi:hypothetical protein
MASYHLVVAKYKEDVRWSENIHPENLYIYDKSGEKTQYIPLKNVGRESHTYIHHIVEHYDNLPDFIIFVQGNPFDHINKDSYNDINIYTIPKYIFNLIESQPKSITSFYGKNHKEHIDEFKGLKLREYCNYFFNSSREEVEFSPGCQYIIPKNDILKHSKKFYIHLLNMLIDGNIPNNWDMVVNKWHNVDNTMDINKLDAWSFERLFSYFFTNDVNTSIE